MTVTPAERITGFPVSGRVGCRVPTAGRCRHGSRSPGTGPVAPSLRGFGVSRRFVSSP